MYFSHPFFLLFLVFPLAFLLYSFRSNKQTLSTIFSCDVLKAICVNSHLIQSALQYRLFLLVIILFIFALAQPISKHSLSAQNDKYIPLVIALDISKSMLKDDIYPSRLQFALSKIQTIMKSDYKLRVGLLLFADNAYIAHPLSEDKSSLSFIANSIDYSKIIEDKTNLFAAIEGANILLKNYKSKNLLILSDIRDFDSFKEESKYAEDNNLSVNLISITKDFSPTYTYSSEDINNILNNLQMIEQKRDLEEKNSKITELFYFPLLLALFLLLFIYGSSLELKRKSINLIVSILLMSANVQSEAAVLDFYHISNAENSFVDKNYDSALLSYEKLPQTHSILYNTANTQYKLELYDKAIKNYIKSLGTDPAFNAKVYYNVANAYVKQRKLHLAKKYYTKSLSLNKDIQALENLKQVEHILANQKHKIANDKDDKYKLPQRISVEKKRIQEALSSDYVVRIEKIVLSEEEKILRALKKNKPIIYLRKLDLQKRSKNVLQD